MTHFLDLHTTDAADLRAIIDQSRAMKDARKGLPKGALDADAPLADRVVALIFEKPSTRTRVSFDVGVRQLGGQTLVLSGADMQLGHGETISDTAQVLSRYVDAIMIRTHSESRVAGGWQQRNSIVFACRRPVRVRHDLCWTRATRP
jgi:ornithine carbamoyltransferase